MKNVLIIGGGGFIGSALVKRFVKDGRYNIVVVEPEHANIDRLDCVSNKIHILRTDIKNQVDIHKCLMENKIDTIVHLVSTLIPSSTLFAYQDEVNDIITPTFNLLKVAAEMNIKFVYFSSGGTIYGNKPTGIFHEDDSLNPISYYGFSKLMLEQAILFEHRTRGLKYLILRPSNPYGPGQNLYGRQGLIAVCLGKILKGHSIEVWGDGSIIRDYIYIGDLAEIVFRLMFKGVENQTLNVGSGIGYSINEVIECLKKNIKCPINVSYKDGRSVDVAAMILDVNKLSMFCPYHTIKLEEGIAKFIKQILPE